MRVRDFREFEFVLLQRAAWLRDQAESDEDALGRPTLTTTGIGPVVSGHCSVAITVAITFS